jgi:DNA polymerase-3 subunit alpha
MCNFDFEFGNTKLPNFTVPDGYSHYDYFREKCYTGLKQRYGENPDNLYIERLEYELSVISNMGYVDYFLIVADFIEYARNKGIPVGPGRGSGAGSICAYCMGITNVDPIKYNLIFERFLNPERVSMPDIDVDFCYERRQEVIDYVIDKYGYDHVSQIITFGTMAARAAIRDVGRAMGMSYAVVDNVAKKIPDTYAGATIGIICLTVVDNKVTQVRIDATITIVEGALNLKFSSDMEKINSMISVIGIIEPTGKLINTFDNGDN